MSIRIKNIDDLELHFDEALKNWDLAPKLLLDGLISDFLDLLTDDFDFAKANYPKLTDLFISHYKTQPPIANIKAVKSQIEEIDTYIDNAKSKKGTENKVLLRLLSNYVKFSNPKKHFSEPKLISFLEANSSSIYHCIDLISCELKVKSKRSKLTYQWQGDPDKELAELHQLMINKYKLIAPETTYEQFKAIFTRQPIIDIKPIRWHEDNASELLYFIYRFEQTSNIEHNTKRSDYQKMTACFIKPNGNTFKANWKQLKQNITINLSLDKQKNIDELINNF